MSDRSRSPALNRALADHGAGSVGDGAGPRSVRVHPPSAQDGTAPVVGPEVTLGAGVDPRRVGRIVERQAAARERHLRRWAGGHPRGT